MIITTKPHHYVEALNRRLLSEEVHRWVDEGELRVGETILLENKAVVAFKKEVAERKPSGYASIGINLMSLDLLKVKDSLSYEKLTYEGFMV